MDLNNMQRIFGEMSGKMGEGLDKIFERMLQGSALKIVTPTGMDIGNDFNDLECLIEGEKRVVGIRVRSGGIVDGIQVMYEGGETGPMHGSSYGGSMQEILFDSGDGLKSIEGIYKVPYTSSFGDGIARLVIKTWKGKTYGTYGSWGSGVKFCLNITEGGEFKGLCGKASTAGNGGFVTKLGLIYKQN